MKRVKQVINYWCDDTRTGKYLGQDIAVAVLDTGIVLHPDFEKRILTFQDYVNDRKMFYDDSGHGTHVCGIIGGCGRLSRGVYTGIAPACSLISIKVLDQKGNGKIQNVLKGLRWVLENKDRYNIRVVNISVGTLPQSGDLEETKLIQAVELLWDGGITVVAAAGNYGPESGTVTTPGISKKVITVGASDDDEYYVSAGQRRNYSGRGPTQECVCKPDLVAPGSYITSCSSSYLKKGSKAYTVKSGTSMATPIVSGACALLLSKYPDMSNVEVKLRLRESCRDLHLPHNQQGWGLLDVRALLSKSDKA